MGCFFEVIYLSSYIFLYSLLNAFQLSTEKQRKTILLGELCADLPKNYCFVCFCRHFAVCQAWFFILKKSSSLIHYQFEN